MDPDPAREVRQLLPALLGAGRREEPPGGVCQRAPSPVGLASGLPPAAATVVVCRGEMLGRRSHVEPVNPRDARSAIRSWRPGCPRRQAALMLSRPTAEVAGGELAQALEGLARIPCNSAA